MRVERGNPAVALGIYARVLEALGLEADIEHLAADDLLGRKLQDANQSGSTRVSSAPQTARGKAMNLCATCQEHTT